VANVDPRAGLPPLVEMMPTFSFSLPDPEPEAAMPTFSSPARRFSSLDDETIVEMVANCDSHAVPLDSTLQDFRAFLDAIDEELQHVALPDLPIRSSLPPRPPPPPPPQAPQDKALQDFSAFLDAIDEELQAVARPDLPNRSSVPPRPPPPPPPQAPQSAMGQDLEAFDLDDL